MFHKESDHTSRVTTGKYWNHTNGYVAGTYDMYPQPCRDALGRLMVGPQASCSTIPFCYSPFDGHHMMSFVTCLLAVVGSYAEGQK